MRNTKRKIAAVMAAAALCANFCMTYPVYASETTAAETEAAAADVTGAPAYRADVTQETIYGTLHGFEKDGSFHWYGVPYAQAPVGEMRWKAPQPLQAWEGVLEADTSRTASQMGDIPKDKIDPKTGKTQELIGDEESAVTLDITRPATDETGLPVLFYIHGGNNQGGNAARLPATLMAQDVNAVIVSINHRVGLQGFITLPALQNGTDEENSGNYGFLDMEAALDWVIENIASFGGDPENITISGSSAGGRNIMAMLISPLFEGKFQKAISFSGGMTTANPEASQKVDAKWLAPLAVEKGVKATEEEAYEWLLTDGDDVRDFLYSLTDEDLSSLFPNAGIRMADFPHLFADGTVLPTDGFDIEKYNEVPILMVNGDSEFSIFAKGDPMFAAKAPGEIMEDADLLAKYVFAETYGSMMYGYFNGEEPAGKMLGHYDSPIYTCTIRWGDNPEVVGDEMAAIFGSYHCITTQMMVHAPSSVLSAYPDQYNSAGFQDMSMMMNNYYKNFLWTGDPNGENLTQWDAWTSLDGTTQLIVDADQEKATAVMSEDHISYDQIFEMMDADTTLSEEDKAEVISSVLSGRWFSDPLDAKYNNPSRWVD